jgi:uncharacterized circularly permuted ATP-grasp superfamily protein
MAIVDWKEVPTWSEFEILKGKFEKMGVPVVLADPRELEFDGRRVAARGKKIDLLYRRVLINDIVARPKECAALVKAYSSGAVCVANNFRCKIPHVKAFFAVLTDPKNAALFSAEEREMIHEHVPWTRVVEDVRSDYNGESIELLNYIRKNREQLVLKPSDEYGGMGVTLGWEAKAKDWDQALQQALPGGKLAEAHGCWIVQKRIPINRRDFNIGTRQGKIPEHAGGFRTLPVPRKNGWLPDPSECIGLGECYQRWRPDPVVSCGAQEPAGGCWRKTQSGAEFTLRRV